MLNLVLHENNTVEKKNWNFNKPLPEFVLILSVKKYMKV